jgi:hypothetical protein
MNVIHYIGLDVHKKTISYCIKTAAGQILQEGTLVAERSVLRSWAASLPQPWHGPWKRQSSVRGSTTR